MKQVSGATSPFALSARVLVFLALLLSMASLCLTACSSEKSEPPAQTGIKPESSATSGPTFKMSYYPSKYSDKKASGSSSARIDTSSVAEGYVGAKAKSKHGLKFQVEKDNSKYNYDLPNTGEATIFPLNMGDGSYRFSIYQNTSGNRYALVYTVTEEVQMNNELEPYLRPNLMCDFDDGSECARKALQLTASARNQGDALEAIYDFVVDNITYDTEKAAELSGKHGYNPVPDETLASGKGICFDYSSLTAAMLRRVGIPCKIVTGYVTEEDLYHAWNMVYIDGTWSTVEIQVSEKTWTRLDTTYAAGTSGMKSVDIASYKDRYVY